LPLVRAHLDAGNRLALHHSVQIMGLDLQKRELSSKVDDGTIWSNRAGEEFPYARGSPSAAW
jgi:hypothetical protein